MKEAKSVDLFVIWGDPCKPEEASIDPYSYTDLSDAVELVNQGMAAGEHKEASIVQLVKWHDGKRWRRASLPRRLGV